MIRHLILLAIVALSFTTSSLGQRMTRAEYIKKYKGLAIKNMRDHKIPASITLAQGLLESDDGNSKLASKYNNHFGIKCHSSWTGKKTYKDDDAKKECFRVYPTVQDSYNDHSAFLHKSRYAKCFELEITDYKNWALELKKLAMQQTRNIHNYLL
jgi:flagellum-specific peptidoglycan hydrolase FlgJ